MAVDGKPGGLAVYSTPACDLSVSCVSACLPPHAEIPGFYFDAAKKRYFKLPPRHFAHLPQYGRLGERSEPAGAIARQPQALAKRSLLRSLDGERRVPRSMFEFVRTRQYESGLHGEPCVRWVSVLHLIGHFVVEGLAQPFVCMCSTSLLIYPPVCEDTGVDLCSYVAHNARRWETVSVQGQIIFVYYCTHFLSVH